MPKLIDYKSVSLKAEKLRKSGSTLKEIAKKLEISYQTLKKAYKDESHKKESQRLKSRIYSYYQKGLSFSEISRITKCSRQYAHKVVRTEFGTPVAS